jgi:hypothetical protein
LYLASAQIDSDSDGVVTTYRCIESGHPVDF